MKLKSILKTKSASSLKLDSTDLVVHKGNEVQKPGEPDQSRRGFLKRSVASATSNALDLSSLGSLARMIAKGKISKPYSLVKVDDETYEFDGGFGTISNEDVEACKGSEGVVRSWMNMAAKIKSSRSPTLEDIFKLTRATESDGPELFGAETYNGWFSDLGYLDELKNRGAKVSAFNANDRKLINDENIFADSDPWKMLSASAQEELARTLTKIEVDYIWMKCDAALTLLK